MHLQFTSTFLVASLLAILTSAAEYHKGFTDVQGKNAVPDTFYSETIKTVPPDVQLPSEDSGGLEWNLQPTFYHGIQSNMRWEGEHPEGIFKRAPSGFVGMRGKKDNDDFTNEIHSDDYNKRAYYGFVGMRGKKLPDHRYESQEPGKRARMMGFVGMRGKKEYDRSGIEYQISPEMYELLGKKQPRSFGLFRFRGKKYPPQFRGKFVGVRGKKSSNEIFDESNSYSNKLNDEDWQHSQQTFKLNQMLQVLSKNRPLITGNYLSELSEGSTSQE